MVRSRCIVITIKEAENLVNRFHENYYEALLYFRDRTWQCFRTLQAKQELYAEVNACFVGKESDVSA